jgi:hypothetical protein
MKLVYIRWNDAGGEYQKWMDGDGLDVRFELQSAGILVYENKEVITIAMDFDGEKFRDVASVPKVNVLEIKYFEVKGSKRYAKP